LASPVLQSATFRKPLSKTFPKPGSKISNDIRLGDFETLFKFLRKYQLVRKKLTKAMLASHEQNRLINDQVAETRTLEHAGQLSGQLFSVGPLLFHEKTFTQ